LIVEIVDRIEEGSFQTIFTDEKESRYSIADKKLFQKVEDSESEGYRVAGGEALKSLKKSVELGVLDKSEIETISISEEKHLREVLEGILLADYKFTKYKSEQKKSPIKRVLVKNFSGAEEIVRRSEILVNSTNFTKEIVNSMPNEMTPQRVAEVGEELGKENGLEIVRLLQEDMEAETMELFLAVGRASTNPPTLLKLAYRPENPKKKVLLIGKGLTYDSGGLSLKPADYMKTMKSDKSGASAVLGIMKAVSELKLDIEVVGFLGLAENMVGGNAYKPDDVLTANNGRTVEVLNTDAEGRLVLADTLLYAQKTEKEFDYILDLATLTGAAVVSVGEFTTLIMGNSDEIKEKMLKAGEDSGELVATLPFNKYLRELIDSKVADIANVGSTRYGGSLTAGLFLNEFINKENRDKWLHLDIAGPAYVEKDWAYNSFGAGGAGVRMVVQFLENLEK
jgi:leucyl aminopeptidase